MSGGMFGGVEDRCLVEKVDLEKLGVSKHRSMMVRMKTTRRIQTTVFRCDWRCVGQRKWGMLMND
jgi:hypothetical protein